MPDLVIPILTRDELEAFLREEGLLPYVDLTEAIDWAVRYHGDQSRDGGGSVIEEHIFPVCMDTVRRSRKMLLGDRRIAAIAALLHDLVEDCGVSVSEIARRFGAAVGLLVDLLTFTKAKGITLQIYFERIADSALARLIKFCDRINNLRSFAKVRDRSRLPPFCERTVLFIHPIARIIGEEYAEELLAHLAQLKSSLG